MNQYYKLFAIAYLAISSFVANAQCDTISSISTVSNGASSMVISWPLVANGVDYEYAVSLDNSIPISGIVTSQTSVQIMGIPADRIVYICIRTRCASGLSGWKCSNFKTAPIGTNINNVSANKTTIYPNPVTDVLNFNFANNNAHNISIVNSIGAVVGDYTLPAGTASLNLSHLSSGLYFVKIASEKQAETLKIDKR